MSCYIKHYGNQSRYSIGTRSIFIWIDDDGEWLGATPYKENISEEEAEQIKAELRKRYKKK